MKTSYLSSGRFRFLATMLFFLFLSNSSQAQDGEILQVPFLFSEDEKLDQTELTKGIPRSKELQTEPYLNAPMTRMEYILSRLEADLNDDERLVREYLSNGFGSPRGATTTSFSMKGFARYYRDNGRIIVGYTTESRADPRNLCEPPVTPSWDTLKWQFPKLI